MADASPTAERVALVVPVKAFGDAKKRLADVLSPDQRSALAKRMASRVLSAARPFDAFVVCDDEDVRTWATVAGATAIWTPGLGLNGAVEAGVAHVRDAGFDRAIVSHADLPLAHSYAELVTPGGAPGATAPTATIVPDRHLDGSNVVSIPADAGFRFHYGAGSFAAHRAEATRLGLVVRVLRHPALGWDVDLPADLAHPDLADLEVPR